MLEVYLLKMENYTVGRIEHDVDKDEFSFVPTNFDCPIMYYPFEFYRFGERDLSYKISHDEVYDFLYSRAMDEDRQGIEAYLYEHNMSAWDFWELCKKTRAVNMEDFFWLALDENETWEQFGHPRKFK